MITIHCSTRAEAGDAWRMLRHQEAIDEAVVSIDGHGPLWTAFRLSGDVWSTRRADQPRGLSLAPAA